MNKDAPSHARSRDNGDGKNEAGKRKDKAFEIVELKSTIEEVAIGSMRTMPKLWQQHLDSGFL